MKHYMICILYVEDTIMCGPSSKAIENNILGLGVSKHKQRLKFGLRDEGEVGDFLGIRFENMDLISFICFKQG